MASPSEPVEPDSFKIVVVGDGGVGKTTFLQKVATGELNPEYEPTVNVQINPLDFSTTAGDITFFCWDTAGQEKFGALRDGYYEGADAAIIMFDVTSRTTFKNVPTWLRDITRVCGEDLPVVICGNKVDLQDRQIRASSIRWPKEIKDRNIPYYETSSLSGLNITEPFLYLLQKLVAEEATFLGDSSQEPAPSPEVAQATPSQMSKKQRAKKAAVTPLPADSGV